MIIPWSFYDTSVLNSVGDVGSVGFVGETKMAWIENLGGCSVGPKNFGAGGVAQ